MALAEQGFYWPGMRADVSRICNECDCAMLKRRRGRRDEAGVGRARATDPDELPGDATSEHRSDPQHDDVGSADEASGPGYVWSTPGTGRGSQHSERVRGRTPRRIAGGVPAREGGVATGSVAPETRLRRQGPEARVPGGRAGMDPRHNAGKNTGNEAAVPVVRPGPHHQGVG